MFGAALGDAIWKFREAGFPEEMDILDFNVAGRVGRIFQKNVDPAVLAIFHFVSQACVAFQFGYFSCSNGFGHDVIGLGGIDADKALIRNFHEFPGVGDIFALGFQSVTATQCCQLR